MSQQALTTNLVTLDGVHPLSTTADGSTDYEILDNDGNVVLEVKNDTGSDHDVEVKTTANIGGIDLANSARTCPDGETTLFGPFPPVLFNDPEDTVLILAPSAGLVLTAIGH